MRAEAERWAEILLVLGLLEMVFWTPRSPLHTGFIVALVGSVLWFGLRGRNREELGLRWPSRRGTVLMLAIGCAVAAAIPRVMVASGHPVPANPDWPKLNNLWPYVIWALGQQFLLQSYFYLRFEKLLGGRAAVVVSSVLFALLHLPNVPLTALTMLGWVVFYGNVSDVSQPVSFGGCAWADGGCDCLQFSRQPDAPHAGGIVVLEVLAGRI